MASSPRSRLSVCTILCVLAGLVLSPAPAASQTIRVLQWNTYHGGYGTDGIYDQDRQVAWMASVEPDVISLNEVKASQASSYKARLEAATGTSWYSFHVAAQSDGTGNQILSRFPLLGTSIYRMATNGQYARGVAQAAIDVQGRTLNFFSTHLDHADTTVRLAQVAELKQFVSGFSDPWIVAGDFNAAPTTGEITSLTGEWIDGWEHAVHVGAASAYSPDNPADLVTRTLRERIDYIFVSERSGTIVLAGEKPDTRDLADPNVTRIIGTPDDRGVRPSDHNLFVAAIELGTPPPADDAIPPVVSLLEPVPGTDVADVLVARASAFDDGLLTKVQFVVDGQTVATDRWAPFELTLRVNQLAVGTHTLEAVAIDAAGNRGSSGPREFTVGAGLSAVDEVVLYAADAPLLAGGWRVVADTSAAGGARLHHPDAGAPKVTTALAQPVNYFELVFDAVAGQPYRIWMRLHAERNHYNNDSLHVQFDNAVTSAGAPSFRIGTTAAAEINLEDCSGCGLSGWGWQDNGWGVGVLGPEIRFATHGPQRIRVQTREDGVSVDQVVLSASRNLSTSPGTLKNDTTILQKSLPPAGNQPPAVALTAPAASASFVAPAAIAVTASASDADGAVARVEFFTGDTSIGSSTTAPYSITWQGVAAGTYQLTARAIDDDGVVTISEPVTVTVTVPANQPPAVALTAPAASASFVAPAAIAVTASASDADGAVARVEFFTGDTSIGSSTTAPYSITWQEVAAGTYQLTARAVDDDGVVTISEPVTVTVTVPANQPPAVALTAPAASASFVAPAAITVTASASDADGAVARVEFFTGDTSIGSSTTAPYSITWQGVAAGTYQLTARAADDDGAVAISMPVTVTVAPASPQISLTATTVRLRNLKAADLSWSGAASSSVSVFRDDQVIATVSGATTYRDSLGKPRTATYRVCETGTQTCSNSVTLSF